MDRKSPSFYRWQLLVGLLLLIGESHRSNGLPDTDSYRTLHLDLPAADPQTEATQFLREYDRQAAETCNRVTHAEWKYASNSSDFNRRRMNEQQSVAAKFECLSWRRAAGIDSQRISDANVRRQLLRIYRHGKCGLGDEKYAEYQYLIAQMKDTFNAARVCAYTPVDDKLNGAAISSYTSHSLSQPKSSYYCDLRLDPDLLRLMATSRNERELRHLWQAWHEKTGPPLLNTFMRYMDLANRAARLHGFRDAGDQQRAAYEDSDFYFVVQDLWGQVRPLYKQLFTYVRKGLVQRYGSAVVRPDGPIPAHLLGNMWTQNWQHVADVVRSGARQTADVTGEMVRQGFTPLKMFQTAEEFFTSMGLPAMSPEFWRNSVLQPPVEQHGKCMASAWDFCNNVDFRVRQCTQITREDFVNSHHEMTHVQYFMHYSGQPFVYRDGPNPGFSEAIAHAIGLAVGGPAHLQYIGLMQNAAAPLQGGSSAVSIEYLLDLAMDKLPLMSFALALEQWRWYVFEKGPTGMNARWWDLRMRYQGVIPPVGRTAEHLDATAKFQVVADQDYIRYYVSTVLQFQIFAGLCEAAQHRGPLHLCDFYRSREAGRILSELMQQGASLSASELLKIVTRGKTHRLSVEPMLEFFRPLDIWLEQQNRNEIVIGWNSNLEDVELFQGMLSAGSAAGSCGAWMAVLTSATLVVHILL